MKVSELWLREWVNPPLDHAQLAAQLTLAGLEVDQCSPVAGFFTKVVVGFVVETHRHPEADRLTLCRVNVGAEQLLSIVCGASNVRANLKVAVAMIGAQLPNGMTIKETKLRGELSQGMLCSSSELGIEERSDGILELPAEAPIGMAIRDYLLLDDTIFDINLTPNRADCFSMLGIARDVSVLTNTVLQQPAIVAATITQPSTCSVEVQAPEACPLYVGRLIRGIQLDAETPLWMQERLRRAGIRPIHPVVDVTQYVMLELGQPMHAFDANCIQGGIVVRYANESETLQLLDQQKVTLTPKVLVIADETQPLAMAGVMGGLDSAVQAHTQDIFLESAFFNPLTIAGVARQFGLCTDASQRYERGVDPGIAERAIERATILLQEIVGGEVGPLVKVQHDHALPQIKTISFHPQKVQQITGVSINFALMEELMQRLGLKVNTQTLPWSVQVPTYRFDLTLEVDLVEEMIRIYGYDKIEASTLKLPMLVGKSHPIEDKIEQIAHFFIGRGYHETISYSFVDPELQNVIYAEQPALRLLNPISSELSDMRIGLWPGLLAGMIYNLHRQQTVIRFYETGVVFDLQHGELYERPCVAGLMTGEIGGLHWSEPTRCLDFYDLKGDVQALLRQYTHQATFTAAKHPALHPGQSAKIVINNQPIGWLGVLHPEIHDALGLKDDVILFELDLSCLPTMSPQFHKISKYPQIRRDLSFLVEQSISSAQIKQAVQDVAPELKMFDIFDVYLGEGVPIGQKSLAIALTFQSNEKTLVDAEVNDIIGTILKKLEKEFAIILRTV